MGRIEQQKPGSTQKLMNIAKKQKRTINKWQYGLAMLWIAVFILMVIVFCFPAAFHVPSGSRGLIIKAGSPIFLVFPSILSFFEERLPKFSLEEYNTVMSGIVLPSDVVVKIKNYVEPVGKKSQKTIGWLAISFGVIFAVWIVMLEAQEKSEKTGGNYATGLSAHAGEVPPQNK